MRHDAISLDWIRPLATPYLHGYRPRLQPRGSLRGWWFVCPTRRPARKPAGGQARPRAGRGERGFFVGYLFANEDFAFLNPQPPECLVFAFVQPAGGPLHRRLVSPPGGLVRRTLEYIRWLTHRPPRFEFHENELPALVRHVSMQGWPRARWEHFSRNFFIETLAWLVRSGLVRRLLAGEASSPGRSTRARSQS